MRKRRKSALRDCVLRLLFISDKNCFPDIFGNRRAVTNNTQISPHESEFHVRKYLSAM